MSEGTATPTDMAKPNAAGGLRLGLAAVASLLARPAASVTELAARIVAAPRAVERAIARRSIAPLVVRDAGGGLAAAPGATSTTLPRRQRLALARVVVPRARPARSATSTRAMLVVVRKRGNLTRPAAGHDLARRERLAVSASRRRYESPSMAMTSAWWTTRSMRAVAQAALGKMDGHSANGRFVVRTRLLCS